MNLLFISPVPPLSERVFVSAWDDRRGLQSRPTNSIEFRYDATSPGEHFHHDGKHFPKASNNRGDPLMRIFLRSKAQTKLRSFARKLSHVRLSAVTSRLAFPV